VRMFSERIAEGSRRGRCVLPGGYEESFKFRRGADSCRRADLKRFRVISDEKKKRIRECLREQIRILKGGGLEKTCNIVKCMYNKKEVRAKKAKQ